MRPSATPANILNSVEKTSLDLLPRSALSKAKGLPKTKSIRNEDCLTEFGQKTLGEFLRYILDLKLKTDASYSSIFSEEEIEKLLGDALITDEDLKSRQFFHNFLLYFHEQRASNSSKADDQNLKNLATNQSFFNKKKGQKLANYQNPTNRNRYEADLTGAGTFGQIEVYYSETVGVQIVKNCE